MAKDPLPNGKRGATVSKYLVIFVQSRTCVSHLREHQSNRARSVSHTALSDHGQKWMLQHGQVRRKVPRSPVAADNVCGFRTSWGTCDSQVFTPHTQALCTVVVVRISAGCLLSENPHRQGTSSSQCLGLKSLRQRRGLKRKHPCSPPTTASPAFCKEPDPAGTQGVCSENAVWGTQAHLVPGSRLFRLQYK